MVLEGDSPGANDCEIEFAHVRGGGTSLRRFPVDKEKSGQDDLANEVLREGYVKRRAVADGCKRLYSNGATEGGEL